MSHTNCISTLLDLKDKNITFSKNCIQETQIKNVRSKLILGTLSFQPTHCYHCGHSFDSNIIKHGFKTSRIKLVKIWFYNIWCGWDYSHLFDCHKY